MHALRAALPCQQLTNLRLFVHAAPRRAASTTPPRAAPTAESNTRELLANARQLERCATDPPAQPVAADFPPYEHWAAHPELLQGCEPGSAPLDVAVLLSGGVDSSLALHLLHAAGHRVTAYYLQIWFQEDFRNSWDACPWEEDLEYCSAVCARLGVPLEVVPLSEQYWDRVVAHSIAEIRAGRTPNPDVLCNSRVKFGAFLEHLQALEAGGGARYDRIASGHYARIDRVPAAPNSAPDDGGSGATSEVVARLALTPDAVKDQTYFLAHLSQAQLARVAFPLGALTKPQVRALAAAAALPNQARKDSQGICFLGRVRFSEFVKEHLGEWPGPIVEEESGDVIGYHKGFWFHTVGQRKGVPLSGGPWYVTRKDPDANAVYVSRRYFDDEAAQRRGAFACAGFSWTGDLRPDPRRPLQCKVRHGPHLYGCMLEVAPGGGSGRVELDGADQGLAAGQYAVFYQDGYCLGSAVITAAA